MLEGSSYGYGDVEHTVMLQPTDKQVQCSQVLRLEEFNTDKPIVTKLNSVALVRERTIPTERPPPVGEVSANFCG